MKYSVADTEKGPFSSNCSFSVSAHMYAMIQNGKLYMSKHEKQISYRIFYKEEKERKLLHILLFKMDAEISEIFVDFSRKKSKKVSFHWLQ